MTVEATLDSLANFGPVYEVLGFARLSADARTQFDRQIIRWFLAKGFAVGGSLERGSVDVIGDRGSSYPDLRIELAGDRQMFVCDLGPAKRTALSVFETLARRFHLSTALVRAQTPSA